MHSAPAEQQTTWPGRFIVNDVTCSIQHIGRQGTRMWVLLGRQDWQQIGQQGRAHFQEFRDKQAKDGASSVV